VTKTLDFEAVRNAATPEVCRASMEILDRFQAYHPGIQAMALACTFKTLCEVAGVEPQDIFTYAGNIMGDRKGPQRTGFRAMKSYMEKELKL